MTAPPEGLIVIAKRDCPTCSMIEPVLRQLGSGPLPLTVYSQDDPAFAAGAGSVIHDETLEHSWRLGTEIVPTLLRVENGREVERTYGWHRPDWERLSGQAPLGAELPESRPGCGSKTLDPGIPERLRARFAGEALSARRIEPGTNEDPMEACFERGWTDGLPVVPPTPERVLRMLAGTQQPPDAVIGRIPPNLAPCTVEKVAINAVMAGCRPEYLPVVLAAVKAALREEFSLHGLVCTTMFGSPLIIVNGPVARDIGMNSGGNALGQGNRANATIGRALQLIIRNVGGGRPGEIDRAALGNPGKYTFCFAEAEDTGWEPLSVQQGHSREASTVTLFPGEGVQGVVDQKSRTPESLARSFANSLGAVQNTKIAGVGGAVLVVAPEHRRVFRAAGWSKDRLLRELDALLLMPGDALAAGAGGVAEGLRPGATGRSVSKFRPGGLLIVHAGGDTGLFSAIIPGWPGGHLGANPVTEEIHP